MKKAMVLLIVALFISPLLLCVPKARAAADWKQYDQNNMVTLYYDANSIQRSGDVVRVTIFGKNTPLGTNMSPLPEVDHYIALVEINCRNKTFIQKRIILYRVDGSKIGDASSDGLSDEPDAIHPRSTLNLLFHIVCGF